MANARYPQGVASSGEKWIRIRSVTRRGTKKACGIATLKNNKLVLDVSQCNIGHLLEGSIPSSRKRAAAKKRR